MQRRQTMLVTYWIFFFSKIPFFAEITGVSDVGFSTRLGKCELGISGDHHISGSGSFIGWCD